MPLFLMESGSTIWSWLPPLMMVAGVVVLGVVATMLIKIASRPKPVATEAEAEASQVLQQVHDARYQIEDARTRVAELIGTVQRLSIKLDEKVGRVEKLLATAESKSSQSVVDERAAVKASFGPSPTPSPAMSVEAKPDELPTPQSTSLLDEPLDPLKKAIYQLADSGRQPLEIAGELNEHVGKVELILALRAM